MKAVLSVFQALLFVISYFSVKDSNFKYFIDNLALKTSGSKNISFEPISYSESLINEKEKSICREYYEKYIINPVENGVKPAFDFKLDGKKFSSDLKNWAVSVGEESEEGAYRKNGKTTFITYKHGNSGVEARVEATFYEIDNTFEWTVYIKNNSGENSPVIKDFYAISSNFDTGKSSLYVSKGSKPANDDFTLYKSFINAIPMRFNANGGRTESCLPFFNINGKNFSTIVTVSWTGQWLTKISQRLNGVNIVAGQEVFNTYLLPGEEIRSPLVTVTVYNGSNPVKGFNLFRDFMKDCVYPDYIKPDSGIVLANEFDTRTTDEMIDAVNEFEDDTIEKASYFWMDAGWYSYNESWYDGVGNWTANEKRFKDGLKPLSDAMHKRNMDFLLWYEPERVRENTILYNKGIQENGWIITIDDNSMWNLANPGACEYLSDYINESMKANGVDRYRQDFNFTPFDFWQKADEELYDGRTGICENHYVTNEYKYLDSLLENNENLVIDNCASGGKRLDVEMSRRSIPLWRSDYNCGNADGTLKEDIAQATQSMTYGLSFWLPYSGTNVYIHSEYAGRTGILTNPSYYELNNQFGAYAYQQKMLTENYYPIAAGGLDMEKFLAYQFGNEKEGTVIIYKRENVKEDTFSFNLSGLEEDKTYVITDIDGINPDITASGEKLMTSKTVISIPDTPKCAILNYSQK